LQQGIDENTATDLAFENKELFDNVYQYVIKTILYLNLDKKDVVKISGISRNPVNTNSVLSRETYNVGKNIIIDKRTRVVYDEYTKTGKKMKCPKWLVRGHFRAVGKIDKKIIWVEPFFKGDHREDESILEVNKEYILKIKE
jgi:hypothetical protein